MIFKIATPSSYPAERCYAISTIFDEILGLDYIVEARNDLKTNCITDQTGKILLVEDVLFSYSEDNWLKPVSLPRRKLRIWNISNHNFRVKAVSKSMPVIYGTNPEDSKFLYISENTIQLGLDIFGSVFFMLTRYEEVVLKDKDEFERFPSKSSVAFKNNFLDRPIVNEYIEIFWQCLKTLWPNLLRKKKKFRIFPTHDVDLPFKFKSHSPRDILIKIGGDILKRKQLTLALNNLCQWTNVKRGKNPDPYDSFNWLMKQSEKTGIYSTFYFMAGGQTKYDPKYYLGCKAIHKLISSIANRGHAIGFHPSYISSKHQHIWLAEYQKLKSMIPEINIIGGRQHMLCFQMPATWRIWENNNFQYDSSLMFADHVGFRCGICHEYTVFDLISRKKLRLKERPLILMDCTVIDDRYMGFGRTYKAYDLMAELKNNCRLFDGDFIFLWHNDRFVNPIEREMYKSLINSP